MKQYEKNTYTSKIEGWLKTAENTGCDLCMMVYLYIKSCPAEFQVELFQFFAENVCVIESDRSLKVPDLITVGEVIDYSDEGKKPLKAYINSLYEKGTDVDSFYKEIWDFINSDLYADDKARSVAIFNCFKAKFPYMDISKAITMDSKEFSSYFEAAIESDYLKRISRISNFGFAQKTEKFSMLLDVIESCEDVKMRAILFMMVLDVEGMKSGKSFPDFPQRASSDRELDLVEDFDFSVLEEEDDD